MTPPTPPSNFGLTPDSSANWRTRATVTEVSLDEFASLCAAAIIAGNSEADVAVERSEDLQLRVKLPNGGTVILNLDNPWAETIAADPADRPAIIDRYVGGVRQMVEKLSRGESDEEELDWTRVVPLVRDTQLLQSLKKHLREGMPEQDWVADEFVADLWVFYAFDLDNGMRYLMSHDLPAMPFEREELATRALDNLQERMPSVELHGDGPLHMLTAGGNLEASLLLVDSLWDDGEGRLPIAPESRLVVCVPTRDVVLVTAEDSAEGMAELKRVAEDIFAEGNHRVSLTRLVRQNKQWAALPNAE